MSSARNQTVQQCCCPCPQGLTEGFYIDPGYHLTSAFLPPPPEDLSPVSFIPHASQKLFRDSPLCAIRFTWGDFLRTKITRPCSQTYELVNEYFHNLVRECGSLRGPLGTLILLLMCPLMNSLSVIRTHIRNENSQAFS